MRVAHVMPEPKASHKKTLRHLVFVQAHMRVLPEPKQKAPPSGAFVLAPAA
jgi:hypothetical protein